MAHSKNWALFGSGVLGFLIPAYFAWIIFQENIPQNLATWIMILFLDFLGLTLVYKSGNKKPYLQIGWCVAAACIVLAILFSDSPWHWGSIETLSVLLCALAVTLWLKCSARIAIFAYLLAFLLSGLPLAVDFWHHPEPNTIWVWGWSMVACMLAIYGAEKRDIANTIVPWTAIGTNSILIALCLG
ncbi:MAG: hypothetical protein KBC62_01220 [Candidatus Pacebacteria bacterium]|nr:hypothetical protein [Candidatus Paceibacterota bacterium]MBP9842604.1 hypothetical protein [Candidatus Paceibacterota bacterium]